ncbi:hypothetical protein [Burkholderia pseudomallei]|uniref:hypothetical protein n=1 Tax=Burkholderia pseudomallei TaxID=28450 RepID=UPI000DCF9B32
MPAHGSARSPAHASLRRLGAARAITDGKSATPHDSVQRGGARKQPHAATPCDSPIREPHTAAL